ncbi:DUF362 domain-containing protein [Planctomycetota bacterium]
MTQLKLFKRCPKSGKIVGYRTDTLLGKILFPIIGIGAIAWFLLRVIPKPDRMTYPCQKVALGVGGTFLSYVAAALVSYPIIRRLRRFSPHVAFAFLAALVIGSGVVLIQASPNPKDYVPVLTNIEGANNPMGQGKGLFPGRVAWVQDFEATSWDGENGHWWDDNNTDQAVTDKMFAQAVGSVTGTQDVAAAWTRLFQYRNELNGKGKKDYQAGEKIVVKVNMNAMSKPNAKWTDQGYPSPHMLNAMVKQLVEVVGVKGEDLLIADPSRFFVGPLYEKIRSNGSEEYRKIQFVEKKAQNIPQHVQAQPDTNNPIFFTMPDRSRYKMCLPQCFTDATYIIDYCVVRPHRVFGITSSAKNHFGSVWDFKAEDFQPGALHAFALWDYPTPNKHKDPHSNPVLLGHKTIRNKTLLYLADGLYTPFNQSSAVQRFSTMGNDWLSSLFMSLDPVALESVCYDFIASERNLTRNNPSFNGHQDSQLHESAIAHKPPSGTVYDPENDGIGLKSLGVHEHWNNAKDKQYSRNLGKDKGIELVSIGR